MKKPINIYFFRASTKSIYILNIIPTVCIFPLSAPILLQNFVFCLSAIWLNSTEIWATHKSDTCNVYHTYLKLHVQKKIIYPTKKKWCHSNGKFELQSICWMFQYSFFLLLVLFTLCGFNVTQHLAPVIELSCSHMHFNSHHYWLDSNRISLIFFGIQQKRSGTNLKRIHVHGNER